MDKENRVSIWFGHFKTEEQFDDFLRETYDDEGDVYSQFMAAFKIDYIDSDYQEALYDREINYSKLESASYSESFLDKISVIFSNYNCVVLIYDFDYSGGIKESNGLRFYGALDYEK